MFLPSGIYPYLLPDLPVKEMVVPCSDGYTVYIQDSLSHEDRLKALHHALRHIYEDDFEKTDVDQIEAAAHR